MNQEYGKLIIHQMIGSIICISLLEVCLVKINKISIVMFGIVVFGIVVFGILFFSYNTFDYFDDLSGSIIIGELNKENEYDIYILNLKTNNKKYLDFSIADRSSFAGDSEHLLSSTGGEVYLYDIKLNKRNFICKLPYKSVENIKYIGENLLSFFADNKLVLFDFISNKQKIVTDNVTDKDYSYSKYIEKFYISICEKIYEVDLESKTKKYIADGYAPKISCDGSTLAYIQYDEILCKKCIFIKNMKTGEIYKSNINPYNFVLSPDGKYLLVRKEGRGFGFMVLYANSKETIIYDYKTNREFKIMDHGSYDFVLDWI